MSEHVPIAPKPEVFKSADAGIWFAACVAAGVIGLLVSVIGAIGNTRQFAFSWLVALAPWLPVHVCNFATAPRVETLPKRRKDCKMPQNRPF